LKTGLFSPVMNRLRSDLGSFLFFSYGFSVIAD